MYRTIFLCSTLVVTVLLSACRGPIGIVVTATPEPDTPLATDTPTLALSPISTPTPFPTATAAPVPTPVVTTERVQFAEGATSATRSGTLAAGETQVYLLHAAVEQVLDVHLMGMEAFTITSPVAMAWTSESFSYDGSVGVKTVALPATGDYAVELSAPPTAGTVPYDITFTVLTPPQPGERAERIQFEPGATDVQRRSALTGAPKVYLLHAAAGQEMSVFATTRRVPFRFVITAPDGTTTVSEQLGSEVQVRAANLTLPADGNYLITVTPDSPPDSPLEPLIFDITFEITGEAGAVGPERVIFEAGAVESTRIGTLTGDEPYTYVLNAGAGQIMDVTTTTNSDAALASFTIMAPDDTTYTSQDIDFFGLSRRTIELPSSGDYVIELAKLDGMSGPVPTTDYQATFTVMTPDAGLQRVSFAPGTTSARKRGALAPGGTTQYVLGAAAGQRLNVVTRAFDVPVEFTVTSPSGTVYPSELLGSEVFIFATEIVLPENGDYVVTLFTPPTANPTLYEIEFGVTDRPEG